MKIVFFVNSLSGGGAEKILQTFLKRWESSGWHITIYSVSNEEIPADFPATVSVRFLFDTLRGRKGKLARLGVKIRNGLKLWIYNHFSPTVFYRLFIRGCYDVEVAFIEGYATRIASGSTNARSRKLAWVHIDLAANHWTLSTYRNAEEEKAAYKMFDTVVCVAQDVRSALISLMGSLQDARVLHNPVDVPLIREKALAFAPERPSAKTLFCASGRLVPQKGFDRLVDIFAQLKKDGYSFHLWILGDGPEKTNLARMIATLDLQDNISLLGRQENPYPFMRTADWVVCSSRSEGYSTVISESLILGVPVVSTLCSGVEEQLGDGAFGIVTANRSSALAEALQSILAGNIDHVDYAERARLGGERFDPDQLTGNISRLIANET